jgi:hypothetical protein
LPRPAQRTGDKSPRWWNRRGDLRKYFRKLVSHINNYLLLGYKELQYSIWLQIINILSLETIRSSERDKKKIDYLINKLSNS